MIIKIIIGGAMISVAIPIVIKIKIVTPVLATLMTHLKNTKETKENSLQVHINFKYQRSKSTKSRYEQLDPLYTEIAFEKFNKT